MIKAQTATRKLDKLGRIKIPINLARRLNLKPGDKCEMTIEYGIIGIKKFDSANIQNKAYTGMVRCLDDLTRLCIPKEYLNILKIPTDIKVELKCDEDKLIIFV